MVNTNRLKVWSLKLTPKGGWKLLPLLMVIWTNVYSHNNFFSVDTVPPTILSTGQNLTLTCDLAIEDSLQSWYDRYSGLVAIDNEGPVVLQSTIEITEALNRLDVSRSIQCGTTGTVDVGFFAQDTCGNNSDTSIVSFTIIDTIGPLFIIPPMDIQVQCTAAREDSLNLWVANFAGAIINDDCTNLENFILYEYTDSEGNTGIGSFNTPPSLTINSSACDYSISVNFVAEDECGNQSERIAIFSLIDTIKPVFESTLPDTVIVNCDNVPSARSINATDGCMGSIIPVISDVSNQDPDINTCEHFNYRVDRTYTAADICGNISTIHQVIFVTDTLEPRFIAPADTTIFNISYPDPTITGFPIDVIDNCSSEIVINYSDNVSTEGCQLMIDRRWNLQDLCGSSLELGQNIIVVDNIPPIVVSPPNNMTLTCDDGFNVNAQFQNWVSTFANAIVTDEISDIAESFAAVPGSYDQDDPQTWPGISPGTLDEPACPSIRSGFLQYEDVDFVFVDGCGNVLVLNSTFAISDLTEPMITTEISDQIININNRINCTGDFTVMPIFATDNCVNTNEISFSSGVIPVTAPNSDVPVDTVMARIGPITGPILGGENIIIEVSINNMDANNATEYFNIYGENEEYLGRTLNTLSQCGDVLTSITITKTKLEEWLSDDAFVDFVLAPNVIQGVPTLSINTVCNNSTVSLNFQLENNYSFNINYGVSLNGGTEFELDTPFIMTMPIGDNELVYYARDCALNVDSIKQTISVVDSFSTELLVCPNDTIIVLNNGQCTHELMVPNDFELDNNCGNIMELTSISVSGSTVIDTNEIEVNSDEIIVLLNRGTNTINYTFTDNLEEIITCSYNVIIRDNEFPVITCTNNLTAQIHPSGLLPIIIDTNLILQEVSDNCGIANIQITGAPTGCTNIGSQVNIVVQVVDIAGNTTQCNSNVRLIPYSLEPISDPVLCFGDTIRLFANAPEAPEQNVYSFRWTGPNGYTSTTENPVIPNASAALSGVYNLELTGFNNCITTGSVEVFIQDFTSPDILSSSSSYCIGDMVILRSFSYPSPVDYLWYEGDYPDGILIDRTTEAEVQITPQIGNHSYYLIIETDICATDFAPSAPLSINVLEQPMVTLIDSIYTVCSGESVQFSAISDQTDLIYQWQGPNNYSSDQLTPPPINNITTDQDGIYQLIISRSSCIDTLSIEVVVNDFLTKPIIDGEEFYCDGDDAILQISNYNTSNQYQYQWYLDDSLFQQTTVNNLVVSSLDQSTVGFWSVVAMDSTCNSLVSDSVHIDIIQKLNISINHDDPICETDSVRLSLPSIAGATYQWNGPGRFNSNQQNPTAGPIAGTYSVVVTTELGCETIITTEVDIEVQPIILAIFSDIETCADGTQSTFLNTSIFPDNDIVFSWSGPNGFTSNLERPIISNYTTADNGYYNLVVNRGVCQSESDSIKFEVFDVPQAPILNEQMKACVGDSVNIVITDPDTSNQEYIWTTPMGIFRTNNAQFDINVVNQENAGQYYVKTLKDNCESKFSDTLELLVFRVPTAPSIVSNIPICIGEDLILEVNLENETEYEWIGPNGYSNTNNKITISNISENDEGNYGVRIIRNGCASEFSFINDIQFLEIPSAPTIETSDLSICQDQSSPVEFCIDRDDFVAGIEVTWINSSNSVILGSTADVCFQLESLVGLNPGVNNIVAQRTVNGCQSPPSAPLIAEVFGIPDVTARGGSDFTVCDFDNVFVSATQPLRGSGRWSANNPSISFSSPDELNSQVFGITEGDNIIKWSLSNGPCIDFSIDEVVISHDRPIILENDIYQVDYNSETSLDILQNDAIDTDFELTIIDFPSSGEVEYDDIAEEIIYSSDSRFVGQVSTKYEVCSLLCPDNCNLAQVTINIGNQNDCFAPTIITPNGDGMNDQFVIPCVESDLYSNNELYIFNQWGDEVYYAQPYKNEWSGTFNGKNLPVGTYYYLFKPNQQLEPTKGFLIIER